MNTSLFHQLALTLSHLRPSEPSAQSQLNALIRTCFDFANSGNMDALKQLQAVRHLRDDYALFKKQHPENPAEVNLYAEIEAAFDEMFKCLDKV